MQIFFAYNAMVLLNLSCYSNHYFRLGGFFIMNHISKFTIIALLTSCLLLAPPSENTSFEPHNESYSETNQTNICGIIPKNENDYSSGSGAYIFKP